MSSPINIIFDAICSMTATLCSFFAREVTKKYATQFTDDDDDEITDVKRVFNSSTESMHTYKHKSSPVITSRNLRTSNMNNN